MLKRALPLATALLVMLTSIGCSTKKNTAASRNWQAFTTRYNVYYNGSEHYKQTLKEMETKYEDDYTSQVLMHPAEARADDKKPQPTGDFKRTIEKMQKAIQLHSIKKKPAKKGSSKKEKEFRAREEFNPFLHNAWLMMGRAQYFNGDFLGAAATFMYISRHFTWMPDVVTEARLWEARSYCAMDWLYEAENAMHRVKEKDLTNSSLKALYDFTMGDYLVRSEKYKEAMPYLEAAAKASSGSQKNRIWFLLGQCAAKLDDKKFAYQAFAKAGAGINTDYRTKFNARIKQSEVYTGQNIRKEVNALRTMARYGRNSEFLDQIYYAIGNLYLSRKDTAEAKKAYREAIEKSTRNGIDKALAQLALGAIYFNEGDYAKAQPCYSEAVPQLNDKYPDYKNIKLRSDVLDELAVYSQNVHLQDSLLDLSKLSPEEQMKVCKKIADDLKKKEKEEEEARQREEHLAKQEGAGAGKPASANAPTQFQLNTDKSWYFYNATAKNTGRTEFQKKWGSRKLEDDWRRRNKNTFSFDDETSDSDSEAGADNIAANDSITPEEKEKLDRENDPHYPEYYLKQIPSTEEQKQTCNDIIQEGLYNMGVILKDKLEDYPAARHEFLTLDERYPDNIYRLDSYYNLYLMAVREDDAAAAEKWRSLILSEFPDSPYGAAMQDPDYFNKLRQMYLVQQELYDEAYAAYLADDNKKVHQITENMEKDYPLSNILPKFIFIDALSYVTEKNTEKFKERLTELLQKWPETDMTPMASGILQGLKAGRELQAGVSNSRGILWDLHLSNDTTANAKGADGQPANFERDPNKPQYLVLAFPTDSVNANQLLYEVARFNFSSFTVRDFDLDPMHFGRMGLLVVKGFDNLRDVERYRDMMAKSATFRLPPEVRPIMISKNNFELLLREGRSFEEYFRFEERANVEETEQKVLDEPLPPDDESESAVEAPGDNSPEEGGLSEEEESPETAPAEEENSEEEEPGTPAEEATPENQPTENIEENNEQDSLGR